jgi:hypothetical protein
MWKTLAGLGDMDGDGYDDIGIGAQSAARYLGQVFVVTGPAYGSYLLGADFYHITGDTKYSYLGASVAGPGDVNGDGYDDLLVGAPWGDSGKAYVFLGPPSRWDGTTASASLTLAGSSTSQGVGTLVSKADDLDGDGFADIMVLSGNVYASGGESCSSTVGIVYGPRAGAVDFEASDALITGTSADCGALVPVSGGDNNGDFAPDILIGAPQQSSAGAYSGTTYLFLGGGL